MKYFTGILLYYLKLNFAFGIPLIVKLVSKFIYFSIQITLWGYVLQESMKISVYRYFAVAAAVTSFISLNTDRIIQSKYENGSVIYYLIRPYKFYMFLLTEDLSRSFISLLFTGLPVLIVSYFFFDVFEGITAAGVIYFLISAGFSWGITWCLFFITGLSIFFLKNNEGIIQFRMFFVTLFSGSIIPIYLIPDPWRKIFYSFPFYNMVDTPVTILFTADSILISERLLMQFLWLAIFALSAFLVYRFSLQKIEIMGG